MTASVLPLRCDLCGGPVAPTPAALAAGGMHPRCAVPEQLYASLTASAGGPGVDELILARWALRIAARRSARSERPGSPNTQTGANAQQRVLAVRRPKPRAAQRKLPDPIVGAVRLMAIVDNAGANARASAVLRVSEQVIGVKAAQQAWNLLIAKRVLRFNPERPLEATTMAAIDREAWAPVLLDLFAQSRTVNR